MILSDNEIDAIEDYYDNNNVGQYEIDMIKEFKDKLLRAIDKKIGDIDELLNTLKPWEKDERKVKKLDQNDAEKAALEAIKVYCADYKVNYYEVANDEIAEFCEELFDKRKTFKNVSTTSTIPTATTPTERFCLTFWKSSRKNFLNKKIKNFQKR